MNVQRLKPKVMQEKEQSTSVMKAMIRLLYSLDRPTILSLRNSFTLVAIFSHDSLEHLNTNSHDISIPTLP